ncbi:hypothetical protein EMCRGX_G021665 [Ephydatia muelleri]
MSSPHGTRREQGNFSGLVDNALTLVELGIDNGIKDWTSFTITSKPCTLWFINVIATQQSLCLKWSPCQTLKNFIG